MIRTAGPGHLEDSTVSSGCNPYLAFAAYIAAGMDGIINKIDPGKPNLTNMYELTPAQTKKLELQRTMSFRWPTGTFKLHSRCGSIANCAFHAASGYIKITFSLRFYSKLCLSGWQREH